MLFPILLAVFVISICLVLFRAFWGITWRDVILFSAVMLPTVWLARLNTYQILIGDNPFILLFGVYCLIILLFFFLRDRRTVFFTKRQFRKVLLPFVLLVLIFGMSILFNSEGENDWVGGLLAICYVILPCFAALVIVRCYPMKPQNVPRVMFIFMVGGVFIAILSILSAVAPGLFRTIVPTFRTEVAMGRAFTPIGGANATGAYILITYCLASGQFLAKHRRVLSLAVIIICFLGILTTLARAAVLVLGLVTIYLYGGLLRGLSRRLLLLVIVVVIFLIPAGYQLSKKYSLERLTEFSAQRSVAFRAMSLKAAFHYGLRHAALGGGWGLVYDLQRKKSILTMEQAQREISIDGMPSAAAPHNLFALVFAEAGIVALGLLIFFFWRLWKALKPPSINESPYAHEIVRGFRASLLAVLAMALFQDHLFLTDKLSYATYLFIFTGMAINAVFESEDSISADLYESSYSSNLMYEYSEDQF